MRKPHRSANTMAEPLPAAAARATASPPLPVGAIPRPSDVRVLVVDDDEFTLDATTSILRNCGYDAVGCSSGDERVCAATSLRCLSTPQWDID